MPRPRRFRKNTHLRTQLSWSEQDFMGDAPPSPSRSSLRSRNTGFPESFCGLRNTTLPHPDANLSPDAVLTEDDISVGRALARHRASFMVNRTRSAALDLGEPLLVSSSDDYCPSPVSMDAAGASPSAGSPEKFATIGSLALASLRSADHLAKHQPGPYSRSSRDDAGCCGDSFAMSSSGGSSGGNSPTHAPKEMRGSRSSASNRRRSFLWRLTHR